LSEAELKKKRTERFNTDEKPDDTQNQPQQPDEIMKKSIQKLATTNKSDPNEEILKKKRAERFASTPIISSNPEDVLNKRALKFAVKKKANNNQSTFESDLDILEKRRQRFQQNPQINQGDGGGGGVGGKTGREKRLGLPITAESKITGQKRISSFVENDAKKRQRLERFANKAENTSTQTKDEAA